MDLTQISLFPATAEQIKAHRIRTFEQWGRGLTLEEYLKRPHSAGVDFVVWILARRENPSGLDFFCSCETYQRDAAVSPSVSTGESHVAYGVASVYTPPENRRNGYARHMMRLLHYVLADQRQGSMYIPPFPVGKWGSPPNIPPGLGIGIASTLYSDVGPSFYRRCGIGPQDDNGWAVTAPYTTIWQVPTQQTTTVLEAEWLTEETEKNVWELDAALIRNEIKQSTRACFSFLPDKGVAEVQRTRSLFSISSMGGGGIWGAQIPRHGAQSDASEPSFATWCLDPGREGPPTLLITRLRCTPEEFSVILAAAFQATRDFRLDQVEIWNLDASLHDAGSKMGGVTRERDDHLPSLAWYGPKDVGGEPAIEWKYNEKFCWC